MKLKSIIAAAAMSAIVFGAAAHAEDIAILLDGMAITCPAAPVLKNDSTLVPIRAVSENLGCDVQWNEQAQSVRVYNANTDFTMYIGSNYVTVNNGTQTIPAAPEIISDTTMVPLRAAAELLGCAVGWDDHTETVIISSTGDLGADIFPALSDNERYMLNIFLSNFSEVDFGYFDATMPSRDMLVYFGCMHNVYNNTSAATSITDEEASQYVWLDPNYLHSCYKVNASAVTSSVDRYFGLPVEHGTAAITRYDYLWQQVYANGMYYFDVGEEGDASQLVSVADYMKPLGNNTYEVHFICDWDGYHNTDIYYRTADQVSHKYQKGVAIVRPHIYNGKKTYQLIQYSSERIWN